MVERGHCHAQATVAVTRKLITRTWRTLTRGRPYQFRDLDGNPITRVQAAALARTLRVPADVRDALARTASPSTAAASPANPPWPVTFELEGDPSSTSPCSHSATKKDAKTA